MSVIESMGATLPFTCEQIFDLVADIERYPQFLPGWISARIENQDANICHVEQVVGFGPIRLTFTSTAVLQRPQRIDVTSTDAPFRKYRFTWLVAAIPPTGCRISVAAEFEMRSRLLQHAVRKILPTSIEDTIAAFGARARVLYAAPRGA